MQTNRPKIIKDAGFDFYIDFKKLWRLNLPVTEMDIEKLIWHFEIPFWEKDDTDDWNLTPMEVIKNHPKSKDHQKKVEEADLKYPIDITKKNNKWIILDGIHRLVKAYKLGYRKIKVRVVPKNKIEEIKKRD